MQSYFRHMLFCPFHLQNILPNRIFTQNDCVSIPKHIKKIPVSNLLTNNGEGVKDKMLASISLCTVFHQNFYIKTLWNFFYTSWRITIYFKIKPLAFPRILSVMVMISLTSGSSSCWRLVSISQNSIILFVPHKRIIQFLKFFNSLIKMKKKILVTSNHGNRWHTQCCVAIPE